MADEDALTPPKTVASFGGSQPSRRRLVKSEEATAGRQEDIDPKQEVTTEHGEPTKKKHRGPKHRIASDEQVEAATGLDLESMPPRQAVYVFLCRYCGRSLKKGEDFQYIVTPTEKGFLAYISAPEWSNGLYYGEICETEKEAEVSAARNFISCPQVIRAAKHLPPPIGILVAHEFTKKRQGDQRNLPCKRKKVTYAPIKEAAMNSYNGYQGRCNMQMWA